MEKNKTNNKWGWQGGDNDEWYTPAEAIQPIIKHLKPGAKICCPFDMPESMYVRVLTENGFEVDHSHIAEGKDFFKLDRPDCDYIISNPPYSRRDDVLIRLYEWGIPFAMLLNNNGLFDSRQRAYLAKDHGAEIMFLYPRVKYTDRNGNRNSCPFQSCYWCYRVLPEKMMFEIVREDTGQMRLEGL